MNRAALAEQLAQCHRALGETLAGRRELWHTTYEYRRLSVDSITSIRTDCDHAVVHLDAEADRLRGEIEALKVEIAQFDADRSA